MARVEAADELDALKAQLADFALRHAAESIAKDPKKFLSSDLMKAVEAAALAAVEARLAKEPRPSPEDFAEQVLAQIRPELAAALRGGVAAGPGRVQPAETGMGGLMRELSRHWATVAVAGLLIAAVGGAIGWVAGQGFMRADAERAAAELQPDTESTDGLVVTTTPPPASDTTAAPAAPPAGAGAPSGAAAPKK